MIIENDYNECEDCKFSIIDNEKFHGTFLGCEKNNNPERFKDGNVIMYIKKNCEFFMEE